MLPIAQNSNEFVEGMQMHMLSSTPIYNLRFNYELMFSLFI